MNPRERGSPELYIGRAPSGFLDLLGSKVNGRNPQFLSDVVAPTLDYFQWLTLQRRVYRQYSVTPMNVAGSWHDIDNVVPDGMCYWIHSASLISQAVLGAGTTVRVAIGYKARDGASVQVLKVGPDNTSTVGQYMSATYDGPGFLLRPGQAIGWFVSQLTLGVAPWALLDYEYVPFVL